MGTLHLQDTKSEEVSSDPGPWSTWVEHSGVALCGDLGDGEQGGVESLGHEEQLEQKEPLGVWQAPGGLQLALGWLRLVQDELRMEWAQGGRGLGYRLALVHGMGQVKGSIHRLVGRGCSRKGLG